MRTNFDIIMIALARWDGPYSSTAYSLAKALSKHVRVFYIDNPFTVKDYFTMKSTPQIVLRKNALLHGRDIFTRPDKTCPNLVTVTPRLTLPINWMPDGKIYDAFARMNDSAISAVINETCDAFDVERYILINSFNPLYGRSLNVRIKPLLKIYQSVDDISQSNYVRKHGPRLEREAVRSADFSIATSSRLRYRLSDESKNVHLIPNAADISLFSKARTEKFPRPDELLSVPPHMKVILYTGNVCHRLDYELLSKVARAHRDKVLLIVGPLSSEGHKVLLPDWNVAFTGRKTIDQLPAYLQHSDVAIIPFLCNELTKSIYPLKINEYLATGKPVVSTPFSADILDFQSVAYISGARVHDQFISDIDLAIKQDSPEMIEKRLAFVAGNNWEARALSILELTNQYSHEETRENSEAYGR